MFLGFGGPSLNPLSLIHQVAGMTATCAGPSLTSTPPSLNSPPSLPPAGRAITWSRVGLLEHTNWRKQLRTSVNPKAFNPRQSYGQNIRLARTGFTVLQVLYKYGEVGVLETLAASASVVQVF